MCLCFISFLFLFISPCVTILSPCAGFGRDVCGMFETTRETGRCICALYDGGENVCRTPRQNTVALETLLLVERFSDCAILHYSCGFM